MTIYLAPAVCIVGLLVFALSAEPPRNPKITRIGEIMFFCGLLATLLKGL